MRYEKASQPTMYFIGVTTKESSIMKIFPKWAGILGFNDAVLKGIDIPFHAEPETYRKCVTFIKEDPLSLGALVTTHKIDLYSAASDLFDIKDIYALKFGELSSISKRDMMLCAHAKDPISCGLAMEEFIPGNYWAEHPEAGVYIMGAGGSAISICSYFMRKAFNGNRPSRIVVANKSKSRLDALKIINDEMNPGTVQCEYYLTPEPGMNDEVLAGISEGSLIINATGLGKDRPGSPLTDKAIFPINSMVWEINYRGELGFLHQAESQAQKQNLNVTDGWMYFIYGWTQVVSEVFHVPITKELLDEMARVAANCR